MTGTHPPRPEEMAAVSTYRQILDAQLDQLRADGMHTALPGGGAPRAPSTTVSHGRDILARHQRP